MAHIDLSHVEPQLRRVFAVRLNHTQTLLAAAVVASLTIVGVAAAMMAQF
jgi:hypothetical protein